MRNKSLTKMWFWAALLFIAFTAVNIGVFKANLRWDVTQFRQHTLSSATVKLIGSLKSDIKLTVFFVGIPPKYLEDLLKEYEHYSAGRIKTVIVDPLVDLGYASQFGDTISGKENKLIVQSGQMRRDVDFSKAVLSENQINNAIIRVTRKAQTAYFLGGHREYDIFSEGETGLNKFAKMLLANNIISKKLLLETQGKIPEDCDILIIAGPHENLSTKEQDIVLQYLIKGGDALILTENTIITTPDVPLTDEQVHLNPSLNEILNAWGVSIRPDVVIDIESHASGDVGSPATRNYLTHKAIVQGLDYTFYVRPRSISFINERRASINFAPLVLTASEKDSWGESNRTLNIRFDSGLDVPGPVPIAAVVWEPKVLPPESNIQIAFEKDSDTKMIVFTDADFISNAYIDSYSNAEMGLNAVRWITELDYQIWVDEKDVTIPKLELTSRQKKNIIIILSIVPLLIIISGLIVWLRRK